MDEREQLEKMDLLRTRFNISYAQAKEVLESCGWDAVEATVRLEAQRKSGGRIVEELKVAGSDLIETLKRLLHEGNINRIIVRDASGRELLNIPVNGVIAITLFIPALTALGAVVVMAMDYTVLVEKSV